MFIVHFRARREAEVGSCALDHLQEWMAASSLLEEPAHISKRAILQKVCSKDYIQA